MGTNSSGGVDDNDQVVARGGVACPFPWRLHEMLEAAETEGIQDVVSWQPHGRSFTVYKPKEFVSKILQRFFGQTKYASFQRQLNLYGFSRFSHGKDKGAYFHLAFVRGHRSLVRDMVRHKVKGTKIRRPLLPAEEPNFYAPQWKNHFESTPPPVLVESSHQQQQSLSFTVPHPTTAYYLNLVGYPATTTLATAAVGPAPRVIKKIGNKTLLDILPAPLPLLQPAAPIVVPTSVVSLAGGGSAAAAAEVVPSPLETKSDCSSSSSSGASSWDDPVEETFPSSTVQKNGVNDGDLLFFEGSPFHFLDDATLFPMAAARSSSAHHRHRRHNVTSVQQTLDASSPSPSSLAAVTAALVPPNPTLFAS